VFRVDEVTLLREGETKEGTSESGSDWSDRKASSGLNSAFFRLAWR
jgi:hypothetical protein